MGPVSEAMRENGKVIVTDCMGKGAGAEATKATNLNMLSISDHPGYDNVTGAIS